MTNLSLRSMLPAGAVLLAAAATSARACNVPVFRWALERWEPDLYELVVFTRGELGEEGRAAVAWLKKCSRIHDAEGNFVVGTVDVSKELPQAVEGLWKAFADRTLPFAVLRYPPRARMVEESDVAWSGPLTAVAAKDLVDSPARKKAGEEILAGASGVWILVTCGDRKKDEAALKTVTDAAKLCEKELRLPERPPVPDPFFDDEPAAGPKLKVAFPVVTFDRRDPAEQVFRGMLTNVYPDVAKKFAAEPMLFLMFGRGRAIGPLGGEEINRDQVISGCEFLVGPCSCQIKDQNPGLDILMWVGWDSVFGEEGPASPPLPALAGLTSFLPTTQPATAAARTSSGPAAAGALDVEPESTLLRNLLIVAAVGALVLAAATAVIMRKAGKVRS